jgi:histidyl-tRNA synthetase
VVIVGSDELQSGLLTLKDMTSGEQFKLSIDDIFAKINE